MELEANRKIKILYVVTGLTLSDGVAAYLMNYISNLDLNKFNISVASGDKNIAKVYVDKLQQLGGQLYLFPFIRDVNIFKYNSLVKKFFKGNHDFDIIHCNVTNFGLIYLKEAKKYKIPVRILHSHASKGAYNKFKNIRNKLISFATKHYSNYYFACSRIAGNYLFGKKRKVSLIYNAIDTNRFSYNREESLEAKEFFRVNSYVKIIGFIGRMCVQKNPLYAIDIFNSYAQKDNSAYFIMAGKGPLDDDVKAKIADSPFKDRISFLGEIDNVNMLYKAVDVLIMPSLFEGLPVVGVEAQLSKCFCLFHENISDEVLISSGSMIINDGDIADNWVVELEKIDEKQRENITINSELMERYDIKCAAKNLEKIYLDCIEISKLKNGKVKEISKKNR